MATLQLTDAQLLADYADDVKKSGQMADLAPYCANIVSQAHSRAVSKILSVLVSRGYTKAQIVAAEETGELERQLTLFIAHKRTAIVEGTSDTNLKMLDVQDELKTIVLTTQAGEFITPAGPQGLPRGGLPDTSGDIFVWPDQNDLSNDSPGPGLGQPMDW